MKTTKLLLVLLSFIFFSVNSYAQLQIGNTVFNSNNDEGFGSSVAMNEQGNIVAVAANETDTANGDGSGLVRVFEFSSTSNQWEQKGNDVLGNDFGNAFGFSVSLDSTGNLLAVGAPVNDANGFQSGLVRIFEFNSSNSQWEQKGSSLDEGLGYFTGNSVSFNSTGTRIGIGTPASSSGSHFGSVIVFDFDTNTNDWVQVGNTILGTDIYVNLGYSVALNNQGNILIAGGPGIYTSGNEVNGKAKIFELINNAWVQKGGDLIGTQLRDFFGGNVDINGDGTTVVVGSNFNNENGSEAGKVDVYEFIGADWVQKGTSFLGDQGDRLGISVKINNDGNKVLLGSNRYNNNSGKVELFEYQNNDWSQIGSSILGDSDDDQFGISTSMTSDGNYMVSCANRSDDTNSYFKVFDVSNSALDIIEYEPNNLHLFFDDNNLIINHGVISIKNIEIYNLLGQTLEYNIEESETLKVSFPKNLQVGIYFIKLNTDNGIFNKKVLYRKL